MQSTKQSVLIGFVANMTKRQIKKISTWKKTQTWEITK